MDYMDPDPMSDVPKKADKLNLSLFPIEDKAEQMVGKILYDSRWILYAFLGTGFDHREGAICSERGSHQKNSLWPSSFSCFVKMYLKHLSYIQYCSCVLGLPESFNMWDRRTCVEFPQFKHWFTIIDLELLICTLCDHYGKVTLLFMSKFVMNFALASMWWITRTMPSGFLCTSVTWSNSQRNILPYMLNFSKETLLYRNLHINSV